MELVSPEASPLSLQMATLSPVSSHGGPSVGHIPRVSSPSYENIGHIGLGLYLPLRPRLTLITSLKSPSPNAVTLWVRPLPCEFERDTGQLIA